MAGRAKFTPTLGLNRMVAQMIVGDVDRIVAKVEATAKRKAPPTKKWVTMRDGRVRHSHVTVDGDDLPSNLRFTLRAFEWDVQHPNLGGVRGDLQRGVPGGSDRRDAQYAASSSYLLEPRDRSGEHFAQIVNCRCRIELDPQGVARMVGRTRARARGPRVTATVYAQGPGVVGAEFGDEYPLPSGVRIEPGTRFMRDTVLAHSV